MSILILHNEYLSLKLIKIDVILFILLLGYDEIRIYLYLETM